MFPIFGWTQKKKKKNHFFLSEKNINKNTCSNIRSQKEKEIATYSKKFQL